jgi:hypothetical protein
MDDDLFKAYLNVICKAQEKGLDISVRISGGEPLMLGDRLFDMSEAIFKQTGLKPYILTNGLLVNKETVEKSRDRHVGGIIISMENPFYPDKQAPDPFTIVGKIKQFNSKELPVQPGVVVLRTSEFKNIFNICEWFYERTEQIPCLCELSYSQYESPAQEDLDELYTNIRKALQKYFGKTRMEMFPIIAPECFAGSQTRYVIDMGLNDPYHALELPVEEVLDNIIAYAKKLFTHPCMEESCEWFSNCTIIHPFWSNDTGVVPPEQKFRDYCRFKKTLLNAFYDELTVGETV